MTAWPIVFNFEPSSQGTPAIDIRQGNVGSYTIQAIPDPNYPNTVPADPITGVRILPPQPTVTSLTVSNVTNEYKIDTTIWQMQSGYTASVYFNSNDIFPFKQINLLLTDNTTRTFTTKAAVDAFSNNTSMPFLVTSCIPVNEQYVYRALSVTATSNSTTTPTLTRTFWIRMESDFTKTQDLLLALLSRSQSYIDSIAALNPPTKPFTPPTLSTPTKAPASEVVKQSYTSIVNRNDVSEPDFVMDELFRKKDPSLDIALLEEKSGKDIISLIDQQLADVEVNMKEGIINNSIVPLSDIELLLEQDKNIDCCTCDIPDSDTIKPKLWQYITTVKNYSPNKIFENDKLRIIGDGGGNGYYVHIRVFYKNINTEFKKVMYDHQRDYNVLYENNGTIFAYTSNRIHRINLNELVNVNPTISSPPDILDSVVVTTTEATFGVPVRITKTSTKFFLENNDDGLYESTDLLTWNRIYTLDINAGVVFAHNDVLYFNTPIIESHYNELYRSTNGYDWVHDSDIQIARFYPRHFIKDGKIHFWGANAHIYDLSTSVYRYENNGTYTKIPFQTLDYDGESADCVSYAGGAYLNFRGYPISRMRRSYDLNQVVEDVFSNNQYPYYGDATIFETVDNIYLIFKIDHYNTYVIFQERDIGESIVIE